MDTRSKVFLSLIAVLFVSVLFLLYLNFYKTPTLISTPTTGIIPTAVPTINSTSGWETYTNNKFGFTLSYPENWMIITNATNQTDIVEIKSNGNHVSTYYDFYISYHENPRKLSIPDFYKDYTDNSEMAIPNPFTANAYPDTFQVDNHPGFRFVMPGALANDVVSITLADKRILEIHRIIYGDISVDNINKKIFDQILSTFKFTSSATPTITP